MLWRCIISLVLLFLDGFSPLDPLLDYWALIVQLLTNYTGPALSPLNIITDPGPLGFTERWHIIRVRIILASVFTIYLFISVDPPASCNQGLLKFMCPLGVVYFAEYFINQGLVGSLVSIFLCRYSPTGAEFDLFSFSRWSYSISPISSWPTLSSIAGQLTSQVSPWRVDTIWSCMQVNYVCVLTVCVCAQVPDAVPGWSFGVSLVPLLCEDPETVDPCFAAGLNSASVDSSK